MIETLWTVCAWTGFAWWCGVIFSGTVVVCSAVVESLVVKWEEEQIRRIAASTNNDDLPANWREMDGERSLRECVDEIRLRKTGDA